MRQPAAHLLAGIQETVLDDLVLVAADPGRVPYESDCSSSVLPFAPT